MVIVMVDIASSTALTAQHGRDVARTIIRDRLDQIESRFLALPMTFVKRLGDATVLAGADEVAAPALRAGIAEAAQGDVRVALGAGAAVWTPTRDDIEGSVADLVIGRLEACVDPGGVVFESGLAALLREQPASLTEAFRPRTEAIDGRGTVVWAAQFGRKGGRTVEHRNGNGNGRLLSLGAVLAALGMIFAVIAGSPWLTRSEMAEIKEAMRTRFDDLDRRLQRIERSLTR